MPIQKDRDHPLSQQKFVQNLEMKRYVPLTRRISAESEPWNVTLLVYFYVMRHWMYMLQEIFLKISIFVENFALFHVVPLFFFYLYAFSQEKQKK